MLIKLEWVPSTAIAYLYVFLDLTQIVWPWSYHSRSNHNLHGCFLSTQAFLGFAWFTLICRCISVCLILLTFAWTGLAVAHSSQFWSSAQHTTKTRAPNCHFNRPTGLAAPHSLSVLLSTDFGTWDSILLILKSRVWFATIEWSPGSMLPKLRDRTIKAYHYFSHQNRFMSTYFKSNKFPSTWLVILVSHRYRVAQSLKQDFADFV